MLSESRPTGGAPAYRAILMPMIALGLLATLPGCSEAGSPDQGWTQRDSAGATIIENDPTRPIWQGATSWRISAQPVVRIGVREGDETRQLAHVTHAQRLADGRIAVVNGGTSEIRFYDAQGEFVGALGGPGEGPGEMRIPFYVHQFGGDSLLVVEPVFGVTVFDGEGQYMRKFHPQPSDEMLRGEELEPWGAFDDGSLLFRNELPFEGQGAGVHWTEVELVRFGTDGSFGESFGTFQDQAFLPGDDGNLIFGPAAVVVASDSTVWYGSGETWEFREITRGGRPLRYVRLGRDARPVTDQDLEQYRSHLIDAVRGTPSEQLINRQLAESDVAEQFPTYSAGHVDSEGNLWVGDYQPSHNEMAQRTWSVFDPMGRFLGDVPIPSGLAVYDIGSDYVLGRVRDELDVDYVVMYRLEKPNRVSSSPQSGGDVLGA